MNTYILMRRGPWERCDKCLIVVTAASEPHARVHANAVTGDDTWLEDILSVCKLVDTDEERLWAAR